MRHTFWLGVYPGLSDAHIDHVVETISRFVAD
jgi:CDP-6-deoxy-D-xylo-4-hexulose-3-dehydrase